MGYHVFVLKTVIHKYENCTNISLSFIYEDWTQNIRLRHIFQDLKYVFYEDPCFGFLTLRVVSY